MTEEIRYRLKYNDKLTNRWITVEFITFNRFSDAVKECNGLIDTNIASEFSIEELHIESVEIPKVNYRRILESEI